MFFFEYFVMFFLCLQSLHKCLTSPIFTWILFPLHLLRFILIWDLTHNKPTRDADTLDHLGPRSWQFNEIYRQNSKQEPHKPPDSAESEWRQLGFSVKGKYFTLWKGISRNDFMRALWIYDLTWCQYIIGLLTSSRGFQKGPHPRKTSRDSGGAVFSVLKLVCLSKIIQNLF